MRIYNCGMLPLLDRSNVLVPAVDDVKSEESDTEDESSEALPDEGISVFPAKDNAAEDKMDTVPLKGWLCYPSD